MNANSNHTARVAEALGTPLAGFSAHADGWRRVRVSIRVLSIEALIEEKKARGRSDDLAVLPLLEAAQAAQHRAASSAYQSHTMRHVLRGFSTPQLDADHDETLIDWFLSLEPLERLAELESRLGFFNSVRRDDDTQLRAHSRDS